MYFKLIFKQIASYSSIGIISVLIDILIYLILSDFLLISKSTAKIVSFLIASVNSFFWNKIITFKLKSLNYREPVNFIILYSVSLVANYLIHDYFYNSLQGYIPLIIATIVSVIINFIGLKFWVFKK